jgi:Transposase IS116/IS110/IS902 family
VSSCAACPAWRWLPPAPRPRSRQRHPAPKAALRRLARRYQQLHTEIGELDAELAVLVTATAPDLLELPGVGVETAGQLLTTAGDNPDRLRSEAAFAHLCGAAPIPVSSGRTNRHRLNRGGDRWANCALHTIALTRMRWHEPTRAYVARRRQQGLSTKGDHAVPQAAHRPPDLLRHPPARTNEGDPLNALTDIGASHRYQDLRDTPPSAGGVDHDGPVVTGCPGRIRIL